MKKSYLVSLTTLLLFFFMAPAQAQHGYIKNKIKKKVQEDMKEKYAEPEREKGKKALEDITYENDTRFPIPENPVQATLVLQMQHYKKNGKLDETTTTKIVFGETGECMIINEGDKKENRMLFDYKKAATYIVNEKQKTAIKMPLVNIQKMADKMGSQGYDLKDDAGEWVRTEEIKEVNGYTCRKFVYTNTEEKTKLDTWVTQDITIDLSGNHLFGGQIKAFTQNASTTTSSEIDENYPRGMMIRSTYFSKNSDTPSLETNITSIENSSDPAYFNLSGYEVMDILGKL